MGAKTNIVHDVNGFCQCLSFYHLTYPDSNLPPSPFCNEHELILLLATTLNHLTLLMLKAALSCDWVGSVGSDWLDHGLGVCHESRSQPLLCICILYKTWTLESAYLDSNLHSIFTGWVPGAGCWTPLHLSVLFAVWGRIVVLASLSCWRVKWANIGKDLQVAPAQ